MTKRKPPKKGPMSKGRALIEARIAHGPAAHIVLASNDAKVILDSVGGNVLGAGPTWERALASSRGGVQ